MGCQPRHKHYGLVSALESVNFNVKLIIYFLCLQTDPTADFEECIVSIPIAIVRHSHSCDNAVLKCERLIETTVQRFIVGNFEIRSSMIKFVKLLKVSDNFNFIL